MRILIMGGAGRLMLFRSRGGSHGAHLEDELGGREVVEETSCSAAIAAGRLGHEIQRCGVLKSGDGRAM